jgi:chemotaxis signal transduction protein
MNIAHHHLAKMQAPRKQEAVILFSVAGNLFAIPASSVHEIRSTDNLAGETTALAHPEVSWVRHRLERGGTAYYVVNVGAFYRLPPTRPTLVLVLRNARCAALVDRIERMDALSIIYALPRAFQGEERRWYLGLALFEERVVPMVNPLGFLSREELARLDESHSSASADASATAEAHATAERGAVPA